MAQREGSAYLFYLFIGACVLFLCMATLFFIENNAKQEVLQQVEVWKKKAERNDQDVRELNDAITSLRVLIAGPGAEMAAWPGNEHYLGLMKDKSETVINLALADLKETPRTYGSLVECYGDLDSLLRKLRQGRDESFAKMEASVTSEVKAKSSFDEASTELRKQKDESLSQVQELQSRLEDLDNKSKTEKADLIQKMDKAQDECSERLVAYSRQVNFKDNQIKALENRIDKLLEETRKQKDFGEDAEPDGKIVDVLNSAGKGWIDLGRVDHLSNGLVFRVFQDVKGGKKVYKGLVEVQKIDEKFSEVRVIEEKDSLYPITKGDLVENPFYNRKAQQVFVFAGTEMDSADITKDYATTQLKRYGAQIVEKVDINTDFLVALKNYENTPEYKAARELGVTVIRERDLLEFIGR